MPIKSPVQAFLEQEALERESQARAAERKQIGTLRDLQIMREQKELDEYMQGEGLRQLTRQLETAKTRGALTSLPQLIQRDQAQAQADQAAALQEEAQNRLDIGEPAPAIVEDYIKRGALPEGTEAFKVPLDEDRPSLGEAWAIQIPGREPEIFNKELLKEQRKFQQDIAKIQERHKGRAGTGTKAKVPSKRILDSVQIDVEADRDLEDLSEDERNSFASLVTDNIQELMDKNPSMSFKEAKNTAYSLAKEKHIVPGEEGIPFIPFTGKDPKFERRPDVTSDEERKRKVKELLGL